MILLLYRSILLPPHAQQFGDGNDHESAKVLASYTVILTSLFAVVSALGVICTTPILKLIDTPETLFLCAKGYLEGSSDLLFSATMGICALAVRIVCSYLFVGIWGNMVVAYAEAFSWVFLVIVFSIRYIRGRTPMITPEREGFTPKGTKNDRWAKADTG